MMVMVVVRIEEVEKGDLAQAKPNSFLWSFGGASSSSFGTK